MQKIMFNDKYLLTEAVLKGLKTQTRRIVEVDNDVLEAFKQEYYTATLDYLEGLDLVQAYFLNNPKKVPYKVGEVVAIAQNYKNAGFNPNSLIPTGDGHKIAAYNHKGWSNKMYVKPELMPNRIQIKGWRIENLQDISDEDCLKEGIIKDMRYYFRENVKQTTGDTLVFSCNYDTPREAYAALIDNVSGKGTWEMNKYVFAYDFKLVG